MSTPKKAKKIYYIALALLLPVRHRSRKSRRRVRRSCGDGDLLLLEVEAEDPVGAVVAVLALFMLLVAPPTYWDEVRSISDDTEASPYGTGSARFYQWNVGWGIFLEHPIIGVRQGNFPWNVGAYEQKRGLSFHQRSIAGREAHSMYFTLMPELGLVGIVLFGWMLLLTLKNLWYIQRSAASGKMPVDGPLPYASLAAALEASLVGYLASGAFLSVLYYPNFWLLMGFTLSLEEDPGEEAGHCRPARSSVKASLLGKRALSSVLHSFGPRRGD